MQKEQTPEEKMESYQKNWKPQSGTGKTKFNRMKSTGESWTKLRDETWGSK